jgi:hypothetical protein
MSTAKRKAKTARISGTETLKDVEVDGQVEQAARAFGIDREQLLAYKVYPGGKVVLVAANGMKFVYEAGNGTEPG